MLQQEALSVNVKTAKLQKTKSGQKSQKYHTVRTDPK